MRIEVRVIEDNNETIAEFHSTNVFPPTNVVVDITACREVVAVTDDQSNTYTRLKVKPKPIWNSSPWDSIPRRD